MASGRRSTLDALARAAERAQRIGRLALNLPTELMEKAEEAERKRREQLRDAGEGLDGQLAVFLEQLGGLEGQDFIRMIDTILGPPPAGSGPILTMTAHQP